MQQLIITAVGPDRAGIVAALSRLVRDAGASMADSRMVNLRGHFALLALVEGGDAELDTLRGALAQGAEALGLKVEVARADGPRPTPSGGVPYRLKTYSPDQPGIVAKVTEVLREHGANVEELSTRIESAPFAGTPLFTMDAVVTLPKGASVRTLRAALESLGDDIGGDLDLDPA